MVPPLKFLPVAEEAGLMPSLTALVLDDALAQCASWHAELARGRCLGEPVGFQPSRPGFHRAW